MQERAVVRVGIIVAFGLFLATAYIAPEAFDRTPSDGYAPSSAPEHGAGAAVTPKVPDVRHGSGSIPPGTVDPSIVVEPGCEDMPPMRAVSLLPGTWFGETPQRLSCGIRSWGYGARTGIAFTVDGRGYDHPGLTLGNGTYAEVVDAFWEGMRSGRNKEVGASGIPDVRTVPAQQWNAEIPAGIRIAPMGVVFETAGLKWIDAAWTARYEFYASPEVAASYYGSGRPMVVHDRGGLNVLDTFGLKSVTLTMDSWDPQLGAWSTAKAQKVMDTGSLILVMFHPSPAKLESIRAMFVRPNLFDRWGDPVYSMSGYLYQAMRYLEVNEGGSRIRFDYSGPEQEIAKITVVFSANGR